MDEQKASTSTDALADDEQTAVVPGGTFKCHICALEEHYQYKGNSPSFAKHILLSEDCYLMEDPFSPPGKGEYLTLGSDCSVCSKSVCKAAECSFFYGKTFCITCVKQKMYKFPVPVQMKISKALKS